MHCNITQVSGSCDQYTQSGYTTSVYKLSVCFISQSMGQVEIVCVRMGRRWGVRGVCVRGVFMCSVTSGLQTYVVMFQEINATPHDVQSCDNDNQSWRQSSRCNQPVDSKRSLSWLRIRDKVVRTPNHVCADLASIIVNQSTWST